MNIKSNVNYGNYAMLSTGPFVVPANKSVPVTESELAELEAMDVFNNAVKIEALEVTGRPKKKAKKEKVKDELKAETSKVALDD